MVPEAYHTFFDGCAGVAGTLIGLLFVAISVSPHKHVGRDAPLGFQVQAGVAFTTLLNALVVSLVSLLPGHNLGVASAVLAGGGLSSTLGLLVLTVRHWPGVRHLRGLYIVPVLGVLYGLQLSSGIELLSHPRDPGPVGFSALLVIGLFIIAIARAWQMIGARDVRMLALVSDALRDRYDREIATDTEAAIEPDVASDPQVEVVVVPALGRQTRPERVL